jgi:hypothetical protein
VASIRHLSHASIILSKSRSIKSIAALIASAGLPW